MQIQTLYRCADDGRDYRFAIDTSRGNNRQPFYTITERGQAFARNLVAFARAEGAKA